MADKDVTTPGAEVSASQDSGVTKLTPLELNGIKLDDKHTLLTPDYLDNLLKSKTDPQA